MESTFISDDDFELIPRTDGSDGSYWLKNKKSK